MTASDRPRPRRRLAVTLGAVVAAASVSGAAMATAPPDGPPPTERPTTTEAPTTTTEATTPQPVDTVAPSTTEPPPAIEIHSATLSANAACDPAVGETTLTWTVTNNDTAAADIDHDILGLTFEPDPVPGGESATATSVIDGPRLLTEITETVDLVHADGSITSDSATVHVGRCQGPEDR